ncbi:hypothetical protein B0J11DRAFT_502052 [Dendryphion nanum]|uniref:Uncharacterized protein n=1 Tax=Dendryphion nanum TaxID=256645 RepID=A0A9P9ECP5_9PLEO|nr:hypothetical protein B0J11DRAFT_502052 [Dendryphion nanum]
MSHRTGKVGNPTRPTSELAMTDSTSDPPNEHKKKLIHIGIIPRETIRAAIKVLLNTPAGADCIDIDEAYTTATSVLKDVKKAWPLNVEVGSRLSIQLYCLTVAAKHRLTVYGDEFLIRKYLSPLESYYDYAEIDEAGVRIGPEVLKLKAPRGFNTRNQLIPNQAEYTRKQKKPRTHLVYVDAQNIEDDRWAPAYFPLLLEAAEFKSLCFPNVSARTELWQSKRHEKLRNPPKHLHEMLHFDDKLYCRLELGTAVKKMVNSAENVQDLSDQASQISIEDFQNLSDQSVDEVQSLSDRASRLSIRDRDEFEPILTPLESSGSLSSPPTHMARQPSCPATDVKLEITYTALLCSQNETVTLVLSSLYDQQLERRVLDTTMELWAWMVKQGLNDRLSLTQVVDLARHVVRMKDGGCIDL